MRLLENIHNYDLVTFNWCLARKYRQLMIQISRIVSKTADGHLYGMLGVVLVLTGYYTLAALMTATLIAERLMYLTLKNRLRRNRPPQAIPGFESIVTPSDQFSFPSGHTSAAFLFAGLISAAWPTAALALYPWAILVGCSRVMLGVHFPTDTIAGALLGYIFSVLGLYTLQVMQLSII
ncbi:phosphatase PAP2 family protein [Maricurvus nonylphenolicus]|uniref:phosphatase PAP2 family protein n=1 Tax=Maricurvus nonylphenolicus TaxID=1008307 RepID=UPI0036F1EAA7